MDLKRSCNSALLGTNPAGNRHSLFPAGSRPRDSQLNTGVHCRIRQWVEKVERRGTVGSQEQLTLAPGLAGLLNGFSSEGRRGLRDGRDGLHLVADGRHLL